MIDKEPETTHPLISNTPLTEIEPTKPIMEPAYKQVINHQKALSD